MIDNAARSGGRVIWCAEDGCREHVHAPAGLEMMWEPPSFVLVREDRTPLRPLKRGETARLVYACREHAANWPPPDFSHPLDAPVEKK